MATALERKKSQQRWPEASFAVVEKTVMIGCYCIRKLIESHKLSAHLARQSIRLRAFPHSGRPVTHMNWDMIGKLYDLDSPSDCAAELTWVCNQLIHSFVFVPSFTENGSFDGVFFCSDRERHKSLYQVPVDRLIRLFRQVGNDYPASARMVFNPEKQDYDVTQE
ncbi:MAG: hypothetical protein RDU59_01905 [Thermodesulfobacteriota bacterium]|nr:hypothetical protein [Thermodesulfobacteriota bacterium]